MLTMLKKFSSTFISVVLLSSISVPLAHALPDFARREGVNCTVCHTVVPRLNRTGYEYRNAGYRMPENIGKDVAVKNFFEEMNSARFQDTLVFNRTTTGGTTDTSFDVNGGGTGLVFWLHPLSGSFGKYFGTRGQLTLTEGNNVDIEHANVRMAYGEAFRHFNVRVGVIHPVEGYGGLDLNPVGLSSPLFLTTPANDSSTGSTLFTPLGSNKAAIEAGYTYGNFDFTVAMNNGNYVSNVDPNTGAGDLTASVGDTNKKPATDPNRKRKDFQVHANEFIGDSQSAISALYYHGTETLYEAAGAPAPNWTNTFDRLSLYGTIEAMKPLLVYTGIGVGWDHKLDANSGGPSSTRFRSTGFFVEPFYRLNEDLGTSIRFDYFDPSNATANDRMLAGTLSVNWMFFRGAQAIFEYQYLNAQGVPSGTTTHQAQLALAYAI